MAVAYVKYLGDTSNKTAGTTLGQALQGGGSAAGNLIVASIIFDNAATASKPIVSSISKMAGETNNWVFLGAARSTSTSAGSFASGEMWCIQTTVAWTGTITVTLDTSVTQKAVLMQEFSGVQAVVRSTVGTAYSTTTTQASAATTGTTPVIGDLAIGLIFESNVAAQQAGDTDTLGGSWSTRAGLGSTGSGGASNNFGCSQYKVLTAASHQTFNNSAALSAGNGAIVAILQAIPDPAITQASYRFYDQGTETGSVALGAQDTAINGDITNGDGIGALRVRLQLTTAVASFATDDWQLQWEKNGSGTWNSVALITGTKGPSTGLPTGSGFFFNATSLYKATSFISTGSRLVGVSIGLSKAGAPPGSLTAYLYAHSGTFDDSAAVPTGPPLAVSQSIVASSVPAGPAFTRFYFDGSYSMTNGTPYFVVIVQSVYGDASNQLTANFPSPGVAGTYCASSDGITWGSGSLNDIAYEIYTTTVITAADVAPYNDPNLTDGAATTNRLGAGTGTFVAGRISKTGLVTDLGWTASNFTEVLFPVTINKSAFVNGDTIRFRVLRNGVTTFMTYTQTPLINVVRGAGTTQATISTSFSFTATADAVVDARMEYYEIPYNSLAQGGALNLSPSLNYKTGDLIVVVSLVGGAAVAPNDPTGTGLTFAAISGFPVAPGGSCRVDAWSAVATSNGSAVVSVFMASGGATRWGASMWKFASWANNGIGQIGVQSGSADTTTNLTTSSGSFVVTVRGDKLAGAAGWTPVPSTNATEREDSAQSGYSAYVADWYDQAAGTRAYGQSGTTGGNFTIALIEILPQRTGPSTVEATITTAFGFTATSTAVPQHEATISTAFAFTATSTAVPQHAATINTQFGPPSTAPFLSEPFNDFTTNGWVLVSPSRTTIVAGGRTGNGAQVLTSGTNNGLIKYTIASGSRSADLVVGFAWKLDDFANSPKIVEFYGDTDTTVHTSIRVGNTAGALYYLLGGTTIAFTADGVLAPNTWYYIEVALHLADSPNGTYNIRVNGTTVLSGTGDTKNGGTATVYDTIRLGPNTTFGSPISVYDDLYLDPGSTTFRGDPLSAGPPGVWAATATIQHPATAPGPFTFTATATAVPSHPASISTAFSFTATATAVHTVQATIGAAVTSFVPLYVYPSYLGWWQPFYANPPTWGIVNVTGGPGTSANADYTAGITNLRALGSKLIGYVDTNYGAVSIAQVKTDIDNWLTLYSVDGIFFDRVSSTTSPADIAYMLDASNYAKAKSAGWKVAFNHGTYPLSSSYVDQADFSIVFEDVNSTYTSFSIPGYATYVSNYPKSKWVHLILSCATETDMITALNKAANLGVGNFHATTDTFFAEIPPYYPREITQPQFVFAGTAAATAGPTSAQVEATIATAFPFITTATATPSHPATIATTFGFTATTTAVPTHPATISTAFALTATATAVPQHPATIADTYLFTATATAVPVRPATISTTFGFTATAAAVLTHPATIATTFAFAAVATAVPSRPATIADTYTFTATAVAITTHQATISTAFGFTATADAIPSSPGQATIATTFDFTATATAVRTLPATAVGPYTFTATALATPQHPATISTAFTFTATSTATPTHPATIATVFSFSASTTATPIHPATITTTWTFTATATATSTTTAVTVQATIASQFTFTASAIAKIIGPYIVLNTADAIYVGTQQATAVYVGSTKVWP